jgi:hypothetical protein
LSSGFSFYAMRNGAMLGGIDETSVPHDLKALPQIAIDFLGDSAPAASNSSPVRCQQCAQKKQTERVA